MAATTEHPPTPKLTIYAPTTTGLPPLGPYLQDIWSRRPFMWHLARTTLKSRHYATVMGQVWIILDPIMMAAVYFMLRTVVRPMGSPSERNALIAHLIMGIMVFQYTSSSLNSGARSITGNQQMVLNTAFPRAIFPLVAVFTAFLDFLPTLVVLFLAHALLGQPFGLSLLFFPVLILILTFFNLGLAFIFAPLNVFFRDTGGFLPYLVQIWMYSTPILYRISEIPENLLPYLRWNPLFPFFEMLEDIMNARWPRPTDLLMALGWTALLLGFGVYGFLSKERREFASRI